MPSLTVKTEYMLKLKSLGCYDAWFANIKSAERDGKDLYDLPLSRRFIGASFNWSMSDEGWNYWYKIATSV